jgi:hypothetical protein
MKVRMTTTCLELKLESKDQPLARVLHSYRVYSLSALHARSRLFMATLMGKSCWALVAQALSYCCFAGVSVSPYRREPFLRLTSLGKGVILDRRVIASAKMFLFAIFRLKLCNQIQNSKFVIKFNFQSISYL